MNVVTRYICKLIIIFLFSISNSSGEIFPANGGGSINCDVDPVYLSNYLNSVTCPFPYTVKDPLPHYSPSGLYCTITICYGCFEGGYYGGGYTTNGSYIGSGLCVGEIIPDFNLQKTFGVPQQCVGYP